MPTIAQEAFAEGFAALSEVHATAFTFGATVFDGVASVLKPDDPRMLGSADTVLELQVTPAELPSPSFNRGDQLARDSILYRVSKSGHFDRATGVHTFELVESGPAVATAPELDSEDATLPATGWTVTITPPDFVTVYYTTDGSLPTASNGTEYEAPFNVPGAATVRAVSVRENYTNSAAAVAVLALP